ncbi:MAG: hypothetical protein SF053_06315 [Bacteroidia bacterium]|nr:hypothetical protein [Bacteroidia bacterium]
MKDLIRLIGWWVVLAMPCIQLYAQSYAHVDINTLTQETQRMVREQSSLTLGWWIPDEFWMASLSTNPDVSETQVQELLKLVRDYTVIVVVKGDISFVGSMNFYSQADIAPILTIRAGDGAVYKPLPEDEISNDTQLFFGMMRPMFANMLGSMGENMYFFVFPRKDKSGRRLLDPFRQETFSVMVGSEVLTWRTPIGSLIDPKTCPVDQEKMNGAWNYCPWHGEKLN